MDSIYLLWMLYTGDDEETRIDEWDLDEMFDYTAATSEQREEVKSLVKACKYREACRKMLIATLSESELCEIYRSIVAEE